MSRVCKVSEKPPLGSARIGEALLSLFQRVSLGFSNTRLVKIE